MSESEIRTAEDAIRTCLADAVKNQELPDAPETAEQMTIRHIALLGEFREIVLMEALRRVDPKRADEVAEWLHETLGGADCGQAIHELTWQWQAEIAGNHQLTEIGPVEQPPPPADARPFAWSLRDGTLDVMAVSTEAPGLVAAQQVALRLADEPHRVLPGKWCVVHESSGLPLPGPKGHPVGFPLDIARAVAKRLGTFSIDWTASKSEVSAAVRTHRDEILAVIVETEDCWHCTDADHAPVPPFRPAVAQ